MNRRLVSIVCTILVVSLVLLAFPGEAFAGGTTTITASGSTIGFGATSGTPIWTAQSFTVSAGILTQFSFTLSANSGSPSGTATWIIASGSSYPATVLATGTLTPTASATNTVSVIGGPSLSASTTYWLELKPTSPQTGSNYWAWQCSGATNPYANGMVEQSTDSGVNWPGYPSYDCQATITTTDPTATPTPTNTPSNTPTPTWTPLPTQTPYATYTPYPTYTLLPTYTPYPSYTALPTNTPYPPDATYTPNPTNTAYPANPTYTPYPANATYTPNPTNTDYPANPTYTPFPTLTDYPTNTPYPPDATYTPQSTYTLLPTYTEYPTNTALPTSTDTATAGGPSLTPTDTDTPTITPTPSDTPTPTPDLFDVVPLPNRNGALVRTMDVGEIAIAAVLGFIIPALGLLTFIVIRKGGL